MEDPSKSDNNASTHPSDSEDTKDLLRDQDDNVTDDGDVSDDSDSNDENKDNTGNDQDDQVDFKKRLGDERRKFGEERKEFITALKESDPKRLANILQDNANLRKTAKDQGITIDSLLDPDTSSTDKKSGDQDKATSEKHEISEKFISLAEERNLSLKEAEKASSLAKKLEDAGLSKERAEQNAIDEYFGDASNKKSVGGAMTGGNSSSSDGKVTVDEFFKWDADKQGAYRKKFGNNFA